MLGVGDEVVTLLLILPILKKNRMCDGDLWNANPPVGIKSHTQVERKKIFTHKEHFLPAGAWLIMIVFLIQVPQCPHH